jgi:hypothetical protein
MMKIKKLIYFLLLIMVVLAYGCQKKDLWKGQIRTVDGVTVVENPKSPMYEQPILTLSEELRIGENEDRPEYLFFSIYFIAVDQEENIYVVDGGEKHIKVFDREGTYLKTIGSAGQGPGEFGRPAEIFISEKNHLFITDPGRRQIHLFSADGRYLESKRFTTIYPMMTARDPKGDYYVMNFWMESGTRTGGFDILKLDSNLEVISTLVKISISDNSTREDYDQIPDFAVRNDGYLVFGYTASYRFEILNPEGDVLKTIEKKFELVPKPEKVLKEQQEMAPEFADNIPENYSPFFKFCLDERGRMFVVTPGERTAESIFNLDIFDSEGRYVCFLPIKLILTPILTVAHDRLYVVDEDSEGNHFIKIYKITWKNS